MRKFSTSILASFLGVLSALFILSILCIIVISIMLNMSNKPAKVKPNTVLHLNLSKPVPEQTNNVQIDPLQLETQDILGLRDLLYVLKTAKTDDNIKGIFLDTENVSMGFATVSKLREGIIDFKESGKFVIAHANYLSQGAYYLATTADSIFLNPEAMIDLKGLAAQTYFYKEGMEKLGVDMEVFYAGKFKSATEPYRRNNMSEENRFQIRAYLDELYENFLTDIASSRDISVPQLREAINNWDGSSATLSLERGLVDVIGYEDEAIDVMRSKLGLKPQATIKAIKPEKYFLALPPKEKTNAKDKLALIFVEGSFIGGGEMAGAVAEKHYVKMIRKIRKDKDVKAIVLRVNSGGGSVMTSENIWRELMLAKSVDSISIVTSMASKTASAAYMISVTADSIFAEKNTLTGSIGVFGMYPTIQRLLNEKLGIHIDTVLTGKLSGSFEFYHSFTDAEKELMNKRVNETYDNFLQKVSEGRNKTKEEIHEIAQGRVWTGAQAVDIGLVDRIGSLEEAIEAAAKLGETESFQIDEYPTHKNLSRQIWDDLMNPEKAKAKQQRALLKEQLGSLYPHYQFLHEVSSSKSLQARLPFIVPFK